MRTPIALLAMFVFLPTSSAEEPSFVVIINHANDDLRLDKKAVADIFLKKRIRWNNERAIQPVDQNRKSAVRRRFSEDALGRSVAAVRTYWNQLVFSGRGVPPPELESDGDVVRYVASNEGAIGYVSASVDLKLVKSVQLR